MVDDARVISASLDHTLKLWYLESGALLQTFDSRAARVMDCAVVDAEWVVAAAWDTTLIDSQFDYAVDTSFSAAAKATYDAALARDGQPAANAVKARFAARGITF